VRVSRANAKAKTKIAKTKAEATSSKTNIDRDAETTSGEYARFDLLSSLIWPRCFAFETQTESSPVFAQAARSDKVNREGRQ
jgi:hypothetical protein